MMVRLPSPTNLFLLLSCTEENNIFQGTISRLNKLFFDLIEKKKGLVMFETEALLPVVDIGIGVLK